MGKNAIGDIYVELGTDDISNHVTDCKVSLGRSAVDVTAIGDSWQDYITGGVGRWAVTLGVLQDFASSDTNTGGGTAIWQLAKALMNDTAGTTFLVRPTSAAAGRLNPQIAGVVTLDGDFDMVAAALNAANKFSVTLKGMGAPTYTDTSS